MFPVRYVPPVEAADHCVDHVAPQDTRDQPQQKIKSQNRH